MSIDRYRVVTRHNPVVRSVDPFSPLSVGNGEFAFTADVTGLQTFPEAYEKGIPLCTMAQWAWHEEPADAPKASHRQQVSETFGEGHRPGQTVATGMSPGVGSVAGIEARARMIRETRAWNTGDTGTICRISDRRYMTPTGVTLAIRRLVAARRRSTIGCG